MKKLLRLMSEGRRKRIAYWMFKNQADFLNAVGGNTQLHQWLKANEPFPYFPHRFDLCADIQSKKLAQEAIDHSNSACGM